jgi:hypothetical protein
LSWQIGVFPALNLSDVSITRSLTEVGVPVLIWWNATGGVPPYQLNTSEVASVCFPRVTSPLKCDPTSAGTYAITVTVGDSVNGLIRKTIQLGVVPRLSAGRALVFPDSKILLGDSIEVEANASEGLPPYQYYYSDVPPGCSSVNAPVLQCSPRAIGNWSLRISVNDSLGVVANASVQIAVARSNPNGLTPTEWVTFGIAVAAAISTIILARGFQIRRKRKRVETRAVD